MKDDLHQNEGESDDEGVDIDLYDDSLPVLLLGNGRPVNKEEMLVDIPPRSIADRLVSRFLKTSEPSRGMFCVDDVKRMQRSLMDISCDPCSYVPKRV